MFFAASFEMTSSVGPTTSTPSVPSRSTTLAAPPPVVVITATRWRFAGFLAGEQRRQLEQVFQRVDAQHAVRAEKRVGHFVGAGHRAGVGSGEVLPDFGAAELVDDDGLARRISAARARARAGRHRVSFP